MPVPVSLEPSARKTRMPGGLREVGNLDPQKPMAFVKNADGSTSTVRTIGIGTDRGETVIPTVARDGRIMSNPEAVKQYQSSGENFGTFIDQKSAAAYADELHNKQAELVPENTRGGNMADYWGANWRNFQRGVGLNSTPQEEVTGDLAGGLRDLSTPPAATAPNVYGITTKPLVAGAPTDTARFPKGGGLPRYASNVAGATTNPLPSGFVQSQITQEGRDLVTPSAQVFRPAAGASAPVGKYGWKGSVNAEGNPSLAFGTPGTDGGGVGSWRPGSATPAGPASSPVIELPGRGLSRMEPTGRMIQARTGSDYLPQQTAPSAAPIDFASMDRAGRRFALRNALLSQEQQQQGNTYDLGLRTIANSGANAQLEALTAADRTNAVRENTIAEGGLRQAQVGEIKARTDAGLRLSAAADALTKAKPGSPEYDQALNTYRILSGGEAKAKQDVQMIEEPIDPANPILGTVKRPVRINQDGTFSSITERKAATTPDPLEAEFMAGINAVQGGAAKYESKSPQEKAAMLQRYKAAQGSR